jgi:8-amino-7-oxononanoate synthase
MSESLLAGRVVGGPASARMVIDGQPFVNFSGTGYLALSTVPEIRAAVRRALDEGAPFARQSLSSSGGIDPAFAGVERAAATFCGTEASVYFASGYLIGTVGLASVEQRFDLLILDEHAHLNLINAARSTGLPAFTFTHCDVDSLNQVLTKEVRKMQRPLVITDGVFATSGRIPPLAEYAAALAPYDGRLLVDEAHGFGVVGEHGRGASEFCGVEHVTYSCATLTKAFCAGGAIVGCSAATAVRLRSVPPISCSCAGSPLLAAAATASLTYVAQRPELRKDLRATGDLLRLRLRNAGIDVLETPAPIVSFRWGHRADMLALQRRAFEQGIYIPYSTYVGSGSEGMIRLSVFGDHSREDINALADVLR